MPCAEIAEALEATSALSSDAKRRRSAWPISTMLMERCVRAEGVMKPV